jgi:hypothetical protein
LFDGEPELTSVAAVVDGESDPVVRAGMVEPDVIDETIAFGDLWFPRGYAFSLNGYESDNTNNVPRRPQLLADNISPEGAGG